MAGVGVGFVLYSATNICNKQFVWKVSHQYHVLFYFSFDITSVFHVPFGIS